MLDRIRRAAYRFLAKGNEHPYEGLPLVLITGIGRSGTTALRHSLGAHPDVHNTGKENNIMYDVLAAALHNCTYPSRRVGMMVGQKIYDRQFQLLLLNLLWPAPRTGKDRPKMMLACSDLTPERADYLCRIFPGTRIVYIVRNGVEVVASRMVFHGFMDKPFEWQCEVWSQTQALAEWGADRDDFTLVRHEELLSPVSAERTYRRIFERLGLPFHQGSLDMLLERHFHPTSFPGEKDEDADSLRKRGDRAQLWTGEQRDAFVRICKGAMDYFRYDIPWLTGEGRARD